MKKGTLCFRWWLCSIVILTCVSHRPSHCFSFFPSLSIASSGSGDAGDGNGEIAQQQVPDEDFVHAKIYSAFDEYNNELEYYSHEAALMAWNISSNMTPKNLGKITKQNVAQSDI